MYKYSLDKYPSSLYLDEFNSKELEIIPYQEAGLYRISKGVRTRIGDKPRGHTSVQLEQMRHKGIMEIYLSGHEEFASCEIGPEDRSFEVCLKTQNGTIPSQILENAKYIISNIVEMDLEARNKSFDPNSDYEEELAFIDVKLDEVEFRYYATVVATEWGAYFRLNEDGSWCYKGIG